MYNWDTIDTYVSEAEGKLAKARELIDNKDGVGLSDLLEDVLDNLELAAMEMGDSGDIDLLDPADFEGQL